MSCFSCSSKRAGAAEETYDAPRPACNRRTRGVASTAYIKSAVETEKYTETTEIASLEKEVAVQVTALQYDSDSEEEEYIELDVEKKLQMQHYLYRRGILPPRPSKKPKGRLYLTEGNEDMLSKIDNQAAAAAFKSDELHARWREQERVNRLIQLQEKADAQQKEAHRQQEFKPMHSEL